MAGHFAKPPLRTALSYGANYQRAGCHAQENWERRELVWQIRRVETRIAEVHVRLTGAGSRS
jgi:hypothetical protein